MILRQDTKMPEEKEAWLNFLGDMGPGIDCGFCGEVYHGPMARRDLIDHLSGTHPFTTPKGRGGDPELYPFAQKARR